MNTGIMIRWIENCFKWHGNFLATQKSVLFMDCFGSHCQDAVKDALKKSCNTEVVYIPVKTTSFLQPLDVSINFPFKSALSSAWQDWFENGPQEFTQKGYRKKPR